MNRSEENRIVIIEDEQDIARLISFHLKQAGYLVSVGYSGPEGYQLVLSQKPKLVILDLMLPEWSGEEVCRLIRRHSDLKEIPVLMLTAKSSENDRIKGFEIGADDYLVKPFSPKELVLRVQAILKRTHSQKQNSLFLKKGKLEVDLEKHRVWIEQEEALLTATEFKLLEFFLKSNGRVLTREILLDQVWGYDIAVNTRTVDAHLKRLREKLGESGEWIETVRGVGYRLKDEKSVSN